MAWMLQAGSRSVAFGDDLSGAGLMVTPRVRPIIAGDWFANPRRDGRRFGRQRRVGQVVSLLVEARPDSRPMVEVWREILAVWRADEVRDTPGALATLTTDDGLRAYGMPGELDPDEQYRLFDTNRVTLEFECVDDLWYGPVEETTIGLVPEFTGGLPVPAEVPFVLGGGTGVSDYMVTVGGNVDTWPVFEVAGPIQDPWVEVAGVGRLIFTGALAYDQTLTVDTRPFALAILRNGAAFPGALSPAGARLSDMSLSPGAHQVFFGGYDPTGTSALTVRVESAFTSF